MWCYRRLFCYLSAFGNSQANDLVTELLPITVISCVVCTMQENQFLLFLNHLRLPYSIPKSFALLLNIPCSTPHLCNNGNTDKRSAYRVSEQDAWTSQPQNDSDIRQDCQWQACRRYDKPINQTSTLSNVNLWARLRSGP